MIAQFIPYTCKPFALRQRRTIWTLLLLLALFALSLTTAQAQSGNSITAPDTNGFVGQYTSLVLDSSGNPVVSYYHSAKGDLKVLHCNDANCLGSDESITSPDTGGDVGEYTSLVLDSSGSPVVSYFDRSNEDLKLLHCNDSNCTGGDESITSPDTGGVVGPYTSLMLDNSGYPVVSYYDATNGDLKVLHCGNPDCLVIDSTPPTISASVSGTLGENGWYVGNVTVTFTCADEADGSGIATNTVAGTTLTSEGTGQSVTNSGDCIDNAGNTASSVTVSGINIDKTAPTASATVSPAANANGWHNSDVTVSFSGSDNLSGIATCSSNVIFSSEGTDFSTSGTCTDNAGNVSATATASGINIDKTAPVVSVTGVADGATYILGSVPTAGCDTQDALSGVATAATLSLSGANPDGSGTITATCVGALDSASNSGSATATYTVLTSQEATTNIEDDIAELVDEGVLNNGQANGLTQPLDNAIRSLNRGNVTAACSQLADFTAEVTAKTPQPLDTATAAELIADAEAIRTALGCD